MNLTKFQKFLFITGVIILIIVDYAAIAYLGRGNWDAKFVTVFEFLSIYGLIIGFILQSEAFHEVKYQIAGLTSPNLFIFVGYNLQFLTIFWQLVFLGIRPGKTKRTAVVEAGGCLLVILLPVVLLYSIFHILVVLPITYIGYLLISLMVDSVHYSMHNVIIQWSLGEKGKVNVKDIIQKEPVEVKSFLLSLTAAILSLMVRLVNLFI